MKTSIFFLLIIAMTFQAVSQKSAGFDTRRAASMNPEDPLVLEWLMLLQDHSSTNCLLLPAQEGDDAAQTFNNALVAMAFMVKGERGRAERILDFYAHATVPDNNDSTLQNFFYKGEARGFYQEVSLTTLHNVGHGSDRWMGDMAWLLCAYKYYEVQYQSNRYARIVTLLRDLLVSYYAPAAHGGYIRHGWRKNDSYKHEADGHHEGNIDCFAVLRLCGEDSLAVNIRTWIDNALDGLRDLPLDLYTWRTLAYGPAASTLLDVPEWDSRYRKTISLRGRHVTGFFHGPDPGRHNIWTDGLGHMACAHLTCGTVEKGYYYTNQMDSMMLEGRVKGEYTHALPYAANRTGGYEWVDTARGFTSCAAWYILAKNRVNPFRPGSIIESNAQTAEANGEAMLHPPHPRPCDVSCEIHYSLNDACHVTLELSTSTWPAPRVLLSEDQAVAEHTFRFDPSQVASGVYFITLRTGGGSLTRSLVVLHEDAPVR